MFLDVFHTKAYQISPHSCLLLEIHFKDKDHKDSKCNSQEIEMICSGAWNWSKTVQNTDFNLVGYKDCFCNVGRTELLHKALGVQCKTREFTQLSNN